MDRKGVFLHGGPVFRYRVPLGRGLVAGVRALGRTFAGQLGKWRSNGRKRHAEGHAEHNWRTFGAEVFQLIAMKTIENLPIEEIRCRMGSDCTTEQAREMRRLLINAGLGSVTPSGVLDDVWFAWVDAACREVAS